MRSRAIMLAILLPCLVPIRLSVADPVTVRHTQGFTHAFLVLRTLDGKAIADGDLIQTTKGDRVTDHLAFHFKDGSLWDEVVVFTQHGTFRLLTDHLIQKGPAFTPQMETTIDTTTGKVTVRSSGKNGKEETVNEQLALPTDLANGLIPVLLANLPGNTPKTTLFDGGRHTETTPGQAGGDISRRRAVLNRRISS